MTTFVCLGVVVERDWLDYADVALGGLAAVAGIVALVVALSSAKAAKRSADAAEASATASRAVATHTEEELQIIRREAEIAESERSRRPRLSLSLAAEYPPLQGEFGGPVVLTVTMHNDGDRLAEHVELRVMVSEATATIDSCGAPYGGDITSLAQHETYAALGEGRPSVEWTYVTESHILPVGAATQRHFMISAQPGIVPITVRLFHADALSSGALKWAALNFHFDPSRAVLLDAASA